MYKDKDKQREAGAERTRRYRENRKALLNQGVTDKALQGRVSHEEEILPLDERGITLHPAIIATINRLTTNPDGTVDQQARTIRMANAMHYERVCPGRPYTGVCQGIRGGLK